MSVPPSFRCRALADKAGTKQQKALRTRQRQLQRFAPRGGFGAVSILKTFEVSDFVVLTDPCASCRQLKVAGLAAGLLCKEAHVF